LLLFILSKFPVWAPPRGFLWGGGGGVAEGMDFASLFLMLRIRKYVFRIREAN